MTIIIKCMLVFWFILMACSCNETIKKYDMGTYGYDKAFFERNDIEFLELNSDDGFTRVLIVPAYQGRVMTTTANGEHGNSYGWINYSLIESGKADPQFNAFGGEERFWLGPEGGPYSIYFREGDKQVFENWLVPPVIDTESYDILERDKVSITFTKETNLKNAFGTEFHLGIERKVSLLSKADISEFLNIDIPEDLQLVAYQSDNIITNRGKQAWTKEKGLLSIWMLCMFNPSPSITVFIPYNPDEDGIIVNDDYFGKVPSDRLIVNNNTVYFKIDGEYRSKIGIPPGRAKELCGSYDSKARILTLLWCSIPDEPMLYVNSKWGKQDDPYEGDVINSYNDGPVEDGSVMGPFNEIETSSPAAELSPSESLKHVQRGMHFEGEEEKLASIVRSLFDLELNDIITKFQ